MRKFLLLFIISVISIKGFSQDFSNKGKEFWLAYSYHVGMVNTASGLPTMTLYITSDVTTAYTVEIYGFTIIATGTVNANQVIPIVIPTAYFINNDGLFSKKAIHVTSTRPIVVYSFITRSQASAATLCLPVNVLGKQYYAASFTQISNEGSSNGYITIVGVEDNTSVEIIPTQLTKAGWLPGSVNVVNLNKGDVYQVLGQAGTNAGTSTGSDLTGTSIRSISSGTGGCKRIAVFSGTGKVEIGAPTCSGGSADNLYQQLYPVSTWGKKFLTVPSNGKPNNHYRIIRPDPLTNVYVNGVLISPASFNNNYYQFFNNTPNSITSDLPICVAQYFTSQGCPAGAAPGGNPAPYDPDMIILNPVEQNISDVTLVNTPLTVGGTQIHNLHVVMKNSGTGLSSFLFDGAAIPVGSWVVHPQDPAYSYLYLANIAQGNHTLKSDSGFNAVAYGYGNAETYAYSAGANVKDLYTHPGASSTYSLNDGAACTGTPLKFKISLPYKPDSIYWDLSAIVNTPQYGVEKLLPVDPPPFDTLRVDSVTYVNGKPLYWYSLPNFYSFSNVGSLSIPITAFAPNADGCGNQSDYDFPLDISAPPAAAFGYIAGSCVAEPYQFSETTPQTPVPTYRWYWDFGDPASGASNIISGTAAAFRNPSHTFATPGLHRVKFVNITTSGCVSDTTFIDIMVPDLPNATISGTTNVCINAAQPQITFNITGGTAPYVVDYSLNNVAQASVISLTNTVTINVPTTVATTLTYRLDSVKNQGSTLCKNIITGQTATVTINPNATIAYQAGLTTQTVCVNSPISPIDYTIANGGTGGSFTISPLTAGFTGTYTAATNTYRITGTPTTAGVYTITVKPLGPCVDLLAPGLTATITVNDIATLSLQSGNANQTICANNAMAQITYQLGGGATNALVTGLPAGVTYVYTPGIPFSTVTINGIPPATFSYSISTVSTCANPPPQGGIITVNPDATIAWQAASGSTTQTRCVNTSITEIDYDIAGSVTSVTVTGLPPGVTFAYTPGAPGILKILGTPTTSAGSPYNYSVVINGPCQVPIPQQTGSITVNPDAGINLVSATGSPTACVNNPISIMYQVTGSVTAINFTATLPPGVTYVYTPGNPGIITIAGTPTTSVGGPFNYSISLIGPCQVPPQPKTGTITVTPDATVALQPGTGNPIQTVCTNTGINTIRYDLGGTATGATVTFSPTLLPGVTGTVAGSVVTIAGTPTVVSTTPQVYTYTVQTQGPCGTPQATGMITVNPDHVLTLNAGSENQTVCTGTNISQIQYAFNGGATGTIVTFVPAIPPGITVNTVGNTVTITGSPTASATYTIKTTGNTCQIAQRTGSINIVALPTPNFNWTAPSCNTRVIGFTDNSIANSGTINNWTWTFGDGSPSSNAQNPTHTYLAAGTYNVTLTVTTSPNGCSNAPAFSLPVTINERPHTDFTVPTNACVSDMAQFTDASTFPSGAGVFNAGAYQWNFGDPAGINNIQTGMNGSHQFSAGGTYTVTHISQSAAGCADTITHTVNIASAPVADFSVTNSGALCVNDTVSIVNLSTIGVGNISKLEIYWDFVGAPGTFVVDNAPVLNAVYKHKYPNFQVPVTKPYTVVVRVYSGISCVNQKQTIITLNAVPKVQFNAMPDACYDAAPFQITQASEIGGVPGNGVYSGAGVSPTGLFNPVAAGIGSHIIKYTFTSVAGCVDTMSNTIKVLDTASAKFSYVTPVCDGSAIVFKEESTAPAGVTLNNTTWNFGDGSAVQQHLPGTTFTHTFPTWGTYNVTMFNTSAIGCKSTSTVTALRVNPIPQAVFNFNQTTLCIPNAYVTMNNTSSIADNSAITYAWDFGDPASGVLNTASVKTPPPHLFSGTGPYTVTLTVNGAVGTNGYCQQTITHLVDFIHPQPKTAFSFNKPEVCIGGDVIVTDNTTTTDGSSIIKWYWDFGDGSTDNVRQVAHTYNSATTYNVMLYTTNSNNCNSDTLTQVFRVDAYPSVDAGPDRVVLEGGSVTMQPVVTGFDLQYLWSPATYLTSTTDATPTANIILNDITYTLTVTGRGGCTAPSDNVFIKVLKAPKIPNTFTPNGDGINDKWLIDYLDTYPNCRVQVFTRTGQLVFESKGYKTTWDGTIAGKPLPFDTYYYIVEPGNGRAPLTGYVTIIK